MMQSTTRRGRRFFIAADHEHSCVGIAADNGRKRTVNTPLFDPWEVRRLARFMLQAANEAEGKPRDERVPSEAELGIVVPAAQSTEGAAR